MWLRWLPWRYMVRKIARSRGFIDPIALLTQFNRFSKPAEVIAPTELLRAGAVLAARGLINSQAIQHNLDWVWPHWVEQQFDPQSESFVPRAFSVTHINITHRNWTAVGYPGSEYTPVVDPRGLVMPFFDSWSLDFWLLGKGTPLLIPSRMKQVEQKVETDGNLSIVTSATTKDASLKWRIQGQLKDGKPVCRIDLEAESKEPAMLVVSVRPYNSEGVSFVHSIEKGKQPGSFLINKKDRVLLSESPEKWDFSDYKQGDVYRAMLYGARHEDSKAVCDVGMATAAAGYGIGAGASRSLSVDIPLHRKKQAHTPKPIFTHPDIEQRWDDALREACRIEVPDDRIKFLFDTAIRTMVLHAPHTVYAGPYTYKRFWFRDAVLIGNAMLSVGLSDLVHSISKLFPQHLTSSGYFLSQQGEWDSNGQVLWLLEKQQRMSGKDLGSVWASTVRKAAQWIRHKRSSRDKGLLPPGFSAEHLGPNDNYYWDDYWCAGGLFSASKLMRQWGEEEDARRFWEEGESLMASIDTSLAGVQERLGAPLLPASPHRRMDSGAVGSLAGTYPLQVLRPDDERVVNTLDYLLRECTVDNAFFHDISHSGINPYLTLHIAQALLRNEDDRFWPLVQRIAELASPTGQWPEAIHPRLTTGCMGDGQHVWAAAEWVMMIRNCFVREELEEDIVILCSGIPKEWFTKGARMHFGPTDTAYGPVSVSVTVEKSIRVSWQASWFKREPRIEVAGPGGRKAVPEKGQNSVEFSLKA